MRRTLASPILAISSNNPSAIFADAWSASIRTASRGERNSEGITIPSQEAADIPTSWLSPPDLNTLARAPGCEPPPVDFGAGRGNRDGGGTRPVACPPLPRALFSPLSTEKGGL